MKSLPVLANINESLARTTCEKCVFALGLDPDGAGVQTGCALDRVDKFLVKGTNISLKRLDDHRICYVIDRVCMTCRTEEWAKQQVIPGDCNCIGDALAKLVRKEIQLPLHCVVYADHDDEAAILKTVASLASQTVPPAVVQIILNYDRARPGKLIQTLKTDYAGFPAWLVQTQVPSKDAEGYSLLHPYGQRHGRGRALDLAIDQCDKPYYATFNAGYEVEPDFIAGIDRHVNDELERFLLLQGDEHGNCDVVVRQMHVNVGGNRAAEMVAEEEEGDGPTIEGVGQKIVFLCEKTGYDNLVRDVREFS